MNRDPFYTTIRERLAAGVDPHAFEEAVVDLLRDVHPGLALVPGGSDSGMDGAVADGRDEPIPVVTTTGKDAIGNLTRNLNKYLDDGFPRRKAVFVSSRPLSGQRRKNLYERARELGFALLNIHDQSDIASKLYRDSKWCRDLLGITGQPSPLSSVPRSWRPYSGQPLVGRESSITWLRNLSTDGLLIGQPGSGKTCLAQRLVVEEGFGLFVTARDKGEIANSVREQEPSTIILDDAHVDEELLLDLVHLRRELGTPYRILAISWPGGADRISGLLELSHESKHVLPLLSRDEIVQVVKDAGIEAPRGLVAEIVSQAEGRPGLATTLVHLCKSSTVREVLSGEALGNQLVGLFERLVGPRVKPILATHALAGEAGLPMKAVAEALDLDLPYVHESLVKLAAGGVIYERRDGQSLLVRPPALRHVLVRDVFFAGIALPASVRAEILEHAPEAEVTKTILGARARGAEVSLAEADEMVQRTGLWNDFAWSGEDAASWILAHHPEKVITIARPALLINPRMAIPLLLREAVGDERPLHSHPEHPLRLIQDWVRATFRADEAFARRTTLYRAVAGWIAAEGELGTAVQCVPMIFDPMFDIHEADPGAGTRIYLQRGPLDFSVYERLYALWPEVLRLFAREVLDDWEPLVKAVDGWFFARTDGGGEELYEHLSSMGTEMLLQLAVVASDHPGVRQRLRRMARFRNLEDAIPADPVFDILFPLKGSVDLRRLERDQEGHRARAQMLAQDWAEHLSPEGAAGQLEIIDREQAIVKLSHPNFVPYFTFVLATKVDAPDVLARALMKRKVNANTVSPFLDQTAAGGEGAPLELLKSALDLPTYEGAAILATLRGAGAPPSLTSEALERITGWPGVAQGICRDATTPDQTLIALLEHEDDEVSLQAMRALGYRYVSDRLPEALIDAWIDALCRHAADADEWLVKRVVKGNPALARRWLEALLGEPRLLLSELSDALLAATTELTKADRITLLEAVPSSYGWDEIVVHLVADDDELYDELLHRHDLAHLHLLPLMGEPLGGRWQRRALRALEMGYTTSEVAGALMSRRWSWGGPESVYWQGRIDSLNALFSSEREELREVGRIVYRAYASYRDRAAEEEREEAIFGRPLRWGVERS